MDDDDGYLLRYAVIARKAVPSKAAVKDIPTIMNQLADDLAQITAAPSKSWRVFADAFSNSLYVEYRANSSIAESSSRARASKHKPGKDFAFHGVRYHPTRANNQWSRLVLYNGSKPGDFIYDNGDPSKFVDRAALQRARAHMTAPSNISMAFNPDGYTWSANGATPKIQESFASGVTDENLIHCLASLSGVNPAASAIATTAYMSAYAAQVFIQVAEELVIRLNPAAYDNNGNMNAETGQGGAIGHV
ncbi:uncharacterized protein EV422DRAFT_572063 [Fimicolochytrium jonesii]|uniref:uncharacterized protein n=1 Tax=Fimicolochytrium jonesii TaxID=1396493 RepID=UPI0022FE0723|nr:uncharacterized protein EV422DRAFT_572063 [Fimicolochytrium jonesii]KAI8816169.1 hypothetical protein EV422DRAFT_572063 [Fimicolochytrium jonesii]